MNISQISKRLEFLITRPIIPWVAKSRITPNALTLIGLVLSLITAAVIAAGNLFLGGFLVLLSGLFDMMDGSLARSTGKTTKFGAFLDSTIDRFSEALLLLGLIIFYMGQGDRELVIGMFSLGNEALFAAIVIFTVMIFSFLTSYTRARAEGLGIDCQVGIFPRAGRVILLALIALLGLITVIQRILHVWKQSPDAGKRR